MSNHAHETTHSNNAGPIKWTREVLRDAGSTPPEQLLTARHPTIERIASVIFLLMVLGWLLIG